MIIASAAIGGRNPQVIYTDTEFGTANASSYSVTAAFGDASPRRYIIIGFQAGQLGADLNQPDSCSAGGVAASLVATSGATGTAWKQIWITDSPVPTGTSGTVAIARSGGNMTHGIIHVWAAYDILSVTAVGTVNGAFANPSTGSLTTAANGIAVGHSTTTTAGSWTVGGLTEDAEGTGSGTGATTQWAAASFFKTSAGSISVSFSQAASNAFIAASFQ